LRIGLVSDTHGNVDGLERALDLFDRAAADQILFLGGRWADVDGALAVRRLASAPTPVVGWDPASPGGAPAAPAARPDPLAGRIVRVASRACPEHARDPAAGRHVDFVEGRIVCAVHDKASLSRDDIENASVIFHGNSAHAALVQIGPRCFVTPGHLRAGARAEAPATFALVDLDERALLLKVFSAAAAELRTERAVFGAGGGKLSVK
jgi:predicted phosphodiesterase